MSIRKIRPRFRLPVPMVADEVVRRIRRSLERPGCPCRGKIADRHHVVELRVLERDRHYWSPALSLTVAEAEAEDGGGSVVHGVVGPNPDVWTMFALAYIGLLTLLCFAGTLGLVQWCLGQRPWGLWVSAAVALAAVLMYAISRAGQNLAAPQTAMLRHFLEEALDAPAAERAVTERDPYHERPAGPTR